MAEDKQKMLDEALKQIEKQFGKGSIMKLGEKVYENMEVIPTGSLTLDMALGVGPCLPASVSERCSGKHRADRPCTDHRTGKRVWCGTAAGRNTGSGRPYAGRRTLSGSPDLRHRIL